MKKRYRLIMRWLGIDIVDHHDRHREISAQVTKEEVLNVFFRELPEPSPKR